MMLGKLRRRMVCVLMAVFLVLIVTVMMCMVAISAQQMVTQQQELLRRVAQQSMIRRQDTDDSAEYTDGISFFSVRFDPSGSVTSVYRYAFDISERAATRAAEKALRRRGTSGVLSDQQLRYLIRTDKENYTRVTFISTAQDEAQQRRQLFAALVLIPLLMVLLLVFVAIPLSRWLTRPVQNAWDAQRVFIADASHELKTPLTVILANLSIMLKHKQQTIESCEGWIESTREEAQQMRRLVEEMLMLARAEDEQSAAGFAEVSISDLLEHTLMIIEPVAFDKGVTLETGIEKNVMAVCSETHIRQLMMILLDNAIKYAGGEKKVTVFLAKKQDRCELRVHNTGAPIPEAALPHIFDRFYRADASRTSSGFGLGLAIARQIAQMHRGEIRVTSNANEGTAFTVRIPLRQHRTASRQCRKP